MSTTRQAARGSSRAFKVAAASVGLLLTAAVGSAGLVALDQSESAAARLARDAAVLESAQDWERQRRAQSVNVDPVLESAREWERQRRAQSPNVDPVLEAAREWERQRRVQSPYVDHVLEAAQEWERQRRAQSVDGQ